MYARPARSAVNRCVGTTVTACPCRFAILFETMTQVRVLLGSTPTDGSQLSQTRSPRRYVTSSAAPGDTDAASGLRLFIAVQQVELCLLKGDQRGARIGASTGVVLG